MKQALGHATKEQAADGRSSSGSDNDQISPELLREIRNPVRRLSAQLRSDAQRGREALVEEGISLGLHLRLYLVLVGAYVVPGEPSTDDLLNDVDDLEGGSFYLGEMLGVLKRAIGVLRTIGRPHNLLKQDNLS